MGRGPETIEGHGTTGSETALLESPKADDPGTEKRRHLGVFAKFPGHRVGELRRHRQTLGKPAGAMEPGEQRVATEVLPAVPAEPALPAEPGHPGRAHPISDLETRYRTPHGRDPAHHLVAGNDGVRRGDELSFHDVEIRATHPAHRHLDSDLVRGRSGFADVLEDQRPGDGAARWGFRGSWLSRSLLVRRRAEPLRPKATHYVRIHGTSGHLTCVTQLPTPSRRSRCEASPSAAWWRPCCSCRRRCGPLRPSSSRAPTCIPWTSTGISPSCSQ